MREDDPHLGVDCASCHRGPDGGILGPFGAVTEAHPSTRSEHFTGAGSNALCLACHSRTIGPVIGLGRDFEEAELGERGYRCIDCHMAPIERRLAEGEELPLRQGRSHRLQTPRDPAFLRQAFAIEVEAEGEVLRVSIANRAGHRVPGLTDRVLRFTLELLDSSETVLDSFPLEVSRREPLELGRSLRVELPRAGAVRLRIVGRHEAASLLSPVTFLERVIELDG